MLDGNSFDYLANPVSILKGRLIAFTCLAIYTLVPYSMKWAKIGEIQVFYAQSALFVMLMIALPWFIVRSLGFRARNTAYRNIKFHFRGTYGVAFLNYALLPIIFVTAVFGLTYLALNDRSLAKQIGLYVLLIMFVVSLAYPYFLFRQKRMVVTSSRFGTSPFGFLATTGMYYKAYGWFLLLVLGFTVVLFILGMAAAALSQVLSGSVDFDRNNPFVFLIATYTVVSLFYILLFAFFNAHVGNITFNNLELAGHRLKSDLGVFRLFWIYLTNILAILLTLGLYIPWAKVRTVKYRADHTHFVPAGPLDRFTSAQQAGVSAAGEELGEVFDYDISL